MQHIDILSDVLEDKYHKMRDPSEMSLTVRVYVLHGIAVRKYLALLEKDFCSGQIIIMRPPVICR